MIENNEWIDEQARRDAWSERLVEDFFSHLDAAVETLERAEYLTRLYWRSTGTKKPSETLAEFGWLQAAKLGINRPKPRMPFAEELDARNKASMEAILDQAWDLDSLETSVEGGHDD